MATGLLAGLAGACSSDTIRLAESPFSSPLSTQRRPSEPVSTGAIDPMPSGAVQSQNLPPLPQQMAVSSAPLATPYNNSVSAAPRLVASAAPVNAKSSGWTAYGGTPIVLKQGDTLTSVSSRYGVPAAAILSANGLSNANQIVGGRQIVIPVYNAVNAAPSAHQTASLSQTASIASPPPPPASEPRVIAAPREAAMVAPPARAALPASAPVAAKAPQISAQQEKMHLAILPPTRALPAAKPATTTTLMPKPVPQELVKNKTEPTKIAEKPALQEPKIAAVETKPAAPEKPAAKIEKPALQEPTQTASLPSNPNVSADFRWPARGRVIAGYGNGNEGINIAVPEGTPVKAAESGVVAYAGNELKGYGNLVLIRHDNGYVTAYANNGELNVKRGEKVQRGQTIAKSGQSGNVNAPQLHFEIRKGSTPVDPVPYLAN
jgi:murein DD-endopeptidase MepM/ murein hydrolase activator NlpD